MVITAPPLGSVAKALLEMVVHVCSISSPTRCRLFSAYVFDKPKMDYTGRALYAAYNPAALGQAQSDVVSRKNLASHSFWALAPSRMNGVNGAI